MHMTPQHPHLTEVNPRPIEVDGDRPIEELVDRLRKVRRRVARWVPSSTSLAVLSNDYAEVYRAATRLEEAVRELDAQLQQLGEPHVTSLHLQLLLCTVEERAEEFEESIIETAAMA